jgi:hypothetical protein
MTEFPTRPNNPALSVVSTWPALQPLAERVDHLLRRRQHAQQPGGAGAGGDEFGFGVGQQANEHAGGLRLLAGLG